MYYLILTDNKKTDPSIVLKQGIYDNVYEHLLEYMYQYIINTGCYIKNQIFFSDKLGPDLNGENNHRSAYYIYQKSNTQFNIMYKKKLYGYLYNSYEYTKLSELRIVYDQKYKSTIETFQMAQYNDLNILNQIINIAWTKEEDDYIYTNYDTNFFCEYKEELESEYST